MNLSEDQRHQLDELSIQQGEVLEALGIEPSSGSFTVRYRGDSATKHLKQLEFLPDDNRQSLEDFLFRIDQQTSAAGADQGRLAELRQRSQSEIRALLTPDKFHEYELRNSFPAVQLRFALKELQPSEQEFRAIFDYWTALNEHKWGTPDYREAQQSNETALRSLLGPSRFNIYREGVGALGY